MNSKIEFFQNLESNSEVEFSYNGKHRQAIVGFDFSSIGMGGSRKWGTHKTKSLIEKDGLVYLQCFMKNDPKSLCKVFKINGITDVVYKGQPVVFSE